MLIFIAQSGYEMHRPLHNASNRSLWALMKWYKSYVHHAMCVVSDSGTWVEEYYGGTRIK